jgi:hypothetical protein
MRSLIREAGRPGHDHLLTAELHDCARLVVGLEGVASERTARSAFYRFYGSG